MFETTAQRRRRTRRVGGAAVVALLGVPVWTLAAVALDLLGHRRDPRGHFDAVVVAGCLVLPDGKPSPSLARRTAKAVELWKNGMAPVLVLTGGVGKYPPAEAVVAADYALGLGVPRSAMLLETQSINTIENARFVQHLATLRRIVVVTDTYHTWRCEWIFRHYFESATVVSVESPWFDRAKGAFREAIAVAYHWVRPGRWR